MQTLSSVYTDQGVIVPAQNEANSLYQDGYGSFLKHHQFLVLTPIEVLFLIERGKLMVIDEKTHDRLIFQELLSKFSKSDPHIWTRYIVYRDLRTRGFVTRGLTSSGIDFLVYGRGSFGKKRPKYYVHTIWEGSPESLKILDKILKETTESKRVLRLAVVDRRGEVVYYSLSEIDFSYIDLV
jgi:tRNA-intron endonuclease